MPTAGVMAAGDVVKVRSGKTISLALQHQRSHGLWPQWGRLDRLCDSTLMTAAWSDGTDPVLKITESHTGNTLKTWGHLVSTFAHINAKQFSGGQRNLVVESTGNGPTIPVTAIVHGGPVRFDNPTSIAQEHRPHPIRAAIFVHGAVFRECPRYCWHSDHIQN